MGTKTTILFLLFVFIASFAIISYFFFPSVWLWTTNKLSGTIQWTQSLIGGFIGNVVANPTTAIVPAVAASGTALTFASKVYNSYKERASAQIQKEQEDKKLATDAFQEQVQINQKLQKELEAFRDRDTTIANLTKEKEDALIAATSWQQAAEAKAKQITQISADYQLLLNRVETKDPRVKQQ